MSIIPRIDNGCPLTVLAEITVFRGVRPRRRDHSSERMVIALPESKRLSTVCPLTWTRIAERAFAPQAATVSFAFGGQLSNELALERERWGSFRIPLFLLLPGLSLALPLGTLGAGLGNCVGCQQG